MTNGTIDSPYFSPHHGIISIGKYEKYMLKFVLFNICIFVKPVYIVLALKEVYTLAKFV